MKVSTIEFLKSATTDASVFNANMQHYRLLDGIKNKIQEAWETWDDEITSPYWEAKEKPANSTNSFAFFWIDNEDFYADGYDESKLDEIFG